MMTATVQLKAGVAEVRDMRWKSKQCGLAVVGVVICGLASIHSAAGTRRADEEVHIGVPPVHLRGNDHEFALMETGDYRGLVQMDTWAKQVHIDWSLIDPDTAQYVVEGEQDIALGYWPTRVLAFDGATLYVAGKKERGATIIEEISLGTPTIGKQIGLRAGSVPVVVPPPVTLRQPLYNEATTGRDMVLTMFVNQARPAELFVLFDDSRDLYTLHRTTGAVALHYSASAGKGVPVEPQLVGDFDRFRVYDHVQQGFLYVCTAPTIDGAAFLLLIDSAPARDGTIDQTLYLTDKEWVAMGYTKPENYQ